MKCLKCGKEFPSSMVIEGKRRSLNHRKYCLECSPFGQHNTVKLTREHKCYTCGETNLSKFSKSNFSQCKACKAKYNLRAGKSKRKDIIKYLGNKCRHCGYEKWEPALDVHHLNPELKDRYFSTHNYWSWSRLVNELKNCILLCRNCHAAYHAGLIEENDLIKIPLPGNINQIRECLRKKYDRHYYNTSSKVKESKICNYCGKEFIPASKKNQKYCSQQCAKKASRKVERPSFEELINDLQDLKYNFCAVGRKYNVSDNAVRKWLKSYQKNNPGVA